METKTETKKYKLTFHRSNASVDEWTEHKRYITSDVLVPVFTTDGKLRLAFGHFSIINTTYDWRIETFEYTEIASRLDYNRTLEDINDIATHSVKDGAWIEEEDFTDCIAILEHGFGSTNFNSRTFDSLASAKRALSWQVDDQGRWIGNAFIQQNETAPSFFPEIDSETWSNVEALTAYINSLSEGDVSAEIVADYAVRRNVKFRTGYGYELDEGNTLEDVQDVFSEIKEEARSAFRTARQSVWETPERVQAFAKSENRELRDNLEVIQTKINWDHKNPCGTLLWDLGPNYLNGVGFINNKGI